MSVDNVDMPEHGEPNKRPQLLISDIADDVVVETIYRPDTNETAFVYTRDGEIGTEAEWLAEGVRYLPIKPTNNLLKHKALLLPSAVSSFGTVGELLTDIEVYIGRYVTLSPPAMTLSVAYVLLTWVYDAFNELPYLRFRGDYGTGKTRALLVIGSLCYKAFFASGASTISPIFHALDTFKGTLIFDEADFRFSDEKSELVKILNNGNAQGFPVLRTQVLPNKEFDPRAFSVFGPKIVAMRRSYEDRALESRFLTVEMGPGSAAGVPINLPEAQKAEALELRNKLLTYRLRGRLQVVLDSSLLDGEFESRITQILLPLLSVVPSEERRRLILEMAHGLQTNVISDRSRTSEGQLLWVVAKLSSDDPEKRLSIAEIVSAFSTEYGGEYDRLIHGRWIAGILRRLGIALYKSNGVFVVAPGQQQRLAALYARYGVVGENVGETCGRSESEGSREIGSA